MLEINKVYTAVPFDKNCKVGDVFPLTRNAKIMCAEVKGVYSWGYNIDVYSVEDMKNNRYKILKRLYNDGIRFGAYH